MAGGIFFFERRAPRATFRTSPPTYFFSPRGNFFFLLFIGSLSQIVHREELLFAFLFVFLSFIFLICFLFISIYFLFFFGLFLDYFWVFHNYIIIYNNNIIMNSKPSIIFLFFIFLTSYFFKALEEYFFVLF